MSKLEYYARPLVAFDPKDKAHRRWYYQFVRSSSWGHCPVRFVCPDDTGFDLTIMIKNQMIDYYIRREFDKEENRPKSKKTVDTKTKRHYNTNMLKRLALKQNV